MENNWPVAYAVTKYNSQPKDCLDDLFLCRVIEKSHFGRKDLNKNRPKWVFDRTVTTLWLYAFPTLPWRGIALSGIAMLLRSNLATQWDTWCQQ